MTRAHSTAAFLFAGAIAASGSFSAQVPAKPPAAQAVVQPAGKANAYRQLPPVRLYLGPAPLRADWPGLINPPVQEVTSSDGEAIYNVSDPGYTAFLPESSRNTRRGVLVAPGSYLGAAGEGYFRLALVPSEEECARAVEILEEVL